jgi:hypothetical protein
MKLIPLTFVTLLALPFTANAQVFSDVRAYGTKCGDIQILPDHALIGQKWTVTTKSKDATSGLYALGLKRASLGIGLGCSIYLEPLAVFGWVSKTPGTSTLTFPVPNNKALLKFQFLIQTAAKNTAGYALSRGIEITIGEKKPEE